MQSKVKKQVTCWHLEVILKCNFAERINDSQEGYGSSLHVGAMKQIMSYLSLDGASHSPVAFSEAHTKVL